MEYLSADLPSFSGMDPDLNKAKRDELKALVDEALDLGTDRSNKAELGQRTEQLMDAIANARKTFNQLRYWVVKAFPSSTAIQHQFGVGRFSKANRSQAAMVMFFYELADTVSQHRVALEAAGAPASLLNEITTLGTTLREAETSQEAVKGNRTIDTEERIARLNQVYDILRQFNAAAEFVFYDEPAKRERYRSPHGGNTVEELEEV